ncbi:hypothetical protein CNMCM5623_005380 [Aspergillus felis]|uniref:Uncharacterized protein n=1 Tax=Aspergillus felis TaxID=1287682 RepID=A0A8H6QQR8_9EURO|nr:hypothetical protein CNMCM5623_005380 [Aspergillus felis]KAF7177093.1 hypothetical protein CNMCM7691_004741 [Aspergillus felis]
MSGQSSRPHTSQGTCSRGTCAANAPRSEHTEFEFYPPGSRNPWNLLPKWPVTHRQRIAELDFLASYYDTVGQADNIKAAKDWHASFPLDDEVGYETVYFHRGEIVDRFEINSEEGPAWIEAPPPVIMMSGHWQDSVCAPPRPPATIAGSTHLSSSPVAIAVETNEGDMSESDNAN